MSSRNDPHNKAMEPAHGGPLPRPAVFPRSVVSWLARRGSARTLDSAGAWHGFYSDTRDA